MKKLHAILSISLLLALLWSMAGIQVHKHYCGGYLADLSLYVPSNPCADAKGEESCHKPEKKKCCDDETEFSQLDMDYLAKVKQKLQQVKAPLIASFTTELQREIPNTEIDQLAQDRAPPETVKKKLFLLHQHWTYYL